MEAKKPPQGSTTSGDDAAAQIAQLTAQIADLQQQLNKLTDVAGRAQADLQNAKVRMQKDADEIRKYASEAAIRKLLPVMDNFQRAAAHLPADLQSHDWVKGVLAIGQDFLRQLSDMGVKKMEVVGQPVDTAKHEVLTMGPGEEGKILEVFEDGYELHGKVLRPAKVRVGSG